VAIGARATVPAKAINFAVHEGVQTAFDWSALLAAALDTLRSGRYGRLSHQK
jgi:hypothetical protein